MLQQFHWLLYLPENQSQPSPLCVYKRIYLLPCILSSLCLLCPGVDLSHLERKLRVLKVSRPVEAACKTVAKQTKRIVPSSLLLGTFRLSSLGFSVGFPQL